MKTIKIENGEIRKGYEITELDDDVKDKVINKWREGEDFSYICGEAFESANKFADIFGIKLSCLDYDEPFRNEYKFSFDDQIIDLSGQRLATYIWNNYKSNIFKGKYYSLWSKKDVSYKHYENGYPVLKIRYSKIQLDNCCVLTGVCYDDDLLTPIYEFLDNPKDMNIEELLNDCIYALCHSVSSEIQANLEDDAIIDTIEANDYLYDDEGNMLPVLYHTKDNKVVKTTFGSKNLICTIN